MRRDEFVTSDTHFGHRAVIKYGRRPFQSIEEMTESLIERWNKKVPEQAVVYHLGDFSFLKPLETDELLSRLNGRIRLVVGNHDRLPAWLEKKFEWVKDYYESKTDSDIKVVMCHYPMLTWNRSHYGSWMLHGHCHGNLIKMPGRRMDVGIDTHSEYEPYSFDEVFAYMEQQEFAAVDHHVIGATDD